MLKLDFTEKFIPDEKERLKYLLGRYLPLLARVRTPENQENHGLISKLLEQEPTHSGLLEGIQPAFVTTGAKAKPGPLILSDNAERSLGPNRSSELLGFHADISYMVVQYLNKKP